MMRKKWKFYSFEIKATDNSHKWTGGSMEGITFAKKGCKYQETFTILNPQLNKFS